MLEIQTRYENFQRQHRKSGARRDASHALLADARNEKFGRKRYYPSGSRRRGQRMGQGNNRGRGMGGRDQRIDSDKIDGTKDGNGKVDLPSASLKSKRCGDDGNKAVRCPGQLCGVCRGKGYAAEICASVVSVLACQAPADDKILSGEEEEVVISKA